MLFGEREGYNPEKLVPLEPSRAEDILEELDAQSADIKKRRSLKIVRPSNVRGPERHVDAKHPEQERNLIVRFERAEILRIYKLLREKGAHAGKSSEGEASALLKRFREQAQKLERNLDLLSEQLYKNVHPVEIEGADIGRHVVPVAELCLPDDQRERTDNDTPYVTLAGIATNHHQQAALAMALALQGKRVYAMTHAGNELAETPKDWGARVRQDGTYRLQAKVLQEAVKGLGLKEFHMVGYSMGAGVALEAARDPEFSRAAVRIYVIEPLGLEKLGRARLVYRFAVKETPRVLRDPESKLKALEQGNKTVKLHPGPFLADVGTMTKEQFTNEELAKLRPEGGLRIFVMSKSTLIRADAVREKVQAANELRQDTAAEHPIELYVVEGDAHSVPLTHANGFASMLEHGPDAPSGSEVSAAMLDNSAARALFKETINAE